MLKSDNCWDIPTLSLQIINFSLYLMKLTEVSRNRKKEV